MIGIRKIFRHGFKPCFAEGCTERIPRRFLMCRKHWNMLPNSIQHSVYSTLEIWQRGGSPRMYIDSIKYARIKLAQIEAANQVKGNR